MTRAGAAFAPQSASVRGREAPLGLRPSMPRSRRRSRTADSGRFDEPDLVKHILPAGLEKQRRLDDEHAGALGRLVAGAGFDETAGEGPHDGREPRQLRRVTEDTGAQPGAVDDAVRADDSGPEGRHQRLEAVGAGRVGLVGHAVGVDDVGAELGQVAPDLALAAGDAARESDSDHGRPA